MSEKYLTDEEIQDIAEGYYSKDEEYYNANVIELNNVEDFARDIIEAYLKKKEKTKQQSK